MKVPNTDPQATPLAVFIEALVFLSETVGGYKLDAEEVALELVDSLLADDRKSQEEGMRKLRRMLIQAEGLDNFVDYAEIEEDDTANTTGEDEGYFIAPSEETNRPAEAPTYAPFPNFARAAGVRLTRAEPPSYTPVQMYATPFGIFTGKELGIQ